MKRRETDHLLLLYGAEHPLEVHVKSEPDEAGFDRIVRLLKHECGGRVTGRFDILLNRERKIEFAEGMLVLRYDEMLGNRLIAKIPERVKPAERIAGELERLLSR